MLVIVIPSFIDTESDIITVSMNESSSKDKIEKSIQQSENRVSVAMYKEDSTPLLDKEQIQIDSNSFANFTLSIGHEVDSERTYGIIILQDYIQSNFYYEDQLINQILKFDAKPYTVNNLSLSVKIKPETIELVVLIIKHPDELVKEMDLDKLFYYEQVYTKRYIVEGADLSNLSVEYIDPQYIHKTVNDQTPIFFSEDNSEKKLLSMIGANEKAYLHMGSPFEDQEMNYAVIALENWQQVKVNDKKVFHVKVPTNLSYVYEITTSKVKEETNLQYIAFPYPYEVWNDRYAFKVEQSIRTVIDPDF